MSSRLVYSTDDGRVAKEMPRGNRRPPALPVPHAPADGWVRIWRSKSGRGGKTATLITGVEGTPEEIDRLAVQLRRFAGAGGSVRDGTIEIQGDHRVRMQQRLTELGYRVKLAGG